MIDGDRLLRKLTNFCDSAFAIGESHQDPGLRYIKQIKQRNTEQMYGADNVIVCQVNKVENFVQFNIVGFANEHEHLKEGTEKNKSELSAKVKEMHSQGLSMRYIAQQLAISHTRVERMLKKD